MKGKSVIIEDPLPRIVKVTIRNDTPDTYLFCEGADHHIGYFRELTSKEVKRSIRMLKNAYAYNVNVIKEREKANKDIQGYLKSFKEV
jgi:hypothetical protein